MPPKKVIKITKAGFPDKRHQTSANNVNKARASLISYIQQGKSLDKSSECDTSSSDEDDEEVEPIPTPKEPIQPPKKKKTDVLMEEINSLKTMFLDFNKPPPSPQVIPPIKELPVIPQPQPPQPKKLTIEDQRKINLLKF